MYKPKTRGQGQAFPARYSLRTMRDYTPVVEIGPGGPLNKPHLVRPRRRPRTPRLLFGSDAYKAWRTLGGPYTWTFRARWKVKQKPSFPAFAADWQYRMAASVLLTPGLPRI